MSREIVVNSDNGETRAAILEDGKLVDSFVEMISSSPPVCGERLQRSSRECSSGDAGGFRQYRFGAQRVFVCR